MSLEIGLRLPIGASFFFDYPGRGDVTPHATVKITNRPFAQNPPLGTALTPGRDAMRFKIARVWLMWLLGMAVLAGVMWVLFMFPLPGGSSGLPTLEEVLELAEQLGVSGTITIVAIVFLPPILLTYIEIWKARRSRDFSPAT